MKKITILLVITFTFLFSTTSWGDWAYVAENHLGHKMYYDKDKVRKSGKYLYFWELYDLPKPESGLWSAIAYVKLDCSILRYKFLSWHSYKKSMGEGVGVDENPSDEWRTPSPKMMGEIFYKKICEKHQSLITNKSLGGWNFILESGTGKKWYYDKDSVRNFGKYIHFWELLDYIKPSDGDMSSTRYTELDCSTLQYKTMKFHTYKKSMGEGEQTSDYTPPDKWVSPKPNSIPEVMYKIICEERQ